MKYIFLTKKFYDDYKNCPEIEKNQDRPYMQACIEIDSKIYAVPLRSHITHEHVLWSDKENCCGLDFSKAVLLLKPDEYIDKERSPYIRPKEFKALKGKEYEAEQKLKKYIKQYKKAKSKLQFRENQILCRYSTLQYFEEYL